jgi:hypothetical protein
MKGEHVMRHLARYWNSIWSDMYIKTTFMMYGKGPDGVIGLTLKESSIKQWANSLHICTKIFADLDNRGEEIHQNTSRSIKKK